MCRDPERPEKHLSEDEKLALLVEKGVRLLRERVGEETYFVAFDVPGTGHEAHLKLSRESGNIWRLSIGVVRSGSSRLHSYFLCHGTGQEGKARALSYLERPEAGRELVDAVKELSRHVDQED